MNRTIALICDDNYVMPTVVTIQSIKDVYYQRKDVLIDVFVCSHSLGNENINTLRSLSTDNISVDVIISDVTLYENYLNKINQKSHVTPTSLLKFELPNLFHELDSLLYIDSDIIVKGDLVGLFNLDLSGYYMAACPEVWKYLDSYLNGEDYSVSSNFYFNSGVIMLNLKKMREDNVTTKLWNKKIELAKDETKKTMDQDTLNAICAEKALCIPLNWNFNTVFSNPKVINIKVLNRIMNTNFKTHKEIVDNANILHYVGKEDKPWKYTSANCVSFWDKAYINTGMDINGLKRVSNTHSLTWYYHILKDTFVKNGVGYTIRYLYFKMKNIF